MTKEKMLNIAEKNLKRAKIALQQNFNRPGITEKEREVLNEKVKYAQIVCELVGGM